MGRVAPRLPELGGMTEAGFNRVVETIDEYCFTRRHFCTASWTSVKGLRFCAAGCRGCLETTQRYEEWRASLPKTRNKKQRKADAKRAAPDAVKLWSSWYDQNPAEEEPPEELKGGGR